MIHAHRHEGGWYTLRPLEKPKHSPPEAVEQASFVSWCQAAQIPVHHSPNGVRIGIRQATKLKKEGLAEGFPDLILPTRQCVIEMKQAGAGRPSAAQKYWLETFASIGWIAVVAHGEEAAQWALKELCGDGKRSVCR